MKVINKKRLNKIKEKLLLDAAREWQLFCVCVCVCVCVNGCMRGMNYKVLCVALVAGKSNKCKRSPFTIYHESNRCISGRFCSEHRKQGERRSNFMMLPHFLCTVLNDIISPDGNSAWSFLAGLRYDALIIQLNLFELSASCFTLSHACPCILWSSFYYSKQNHSTFSLTTAERRSTA